MELDVIDHPDADPKALPASTCIGYRFVGEPRGQSVVAAIPVKPEEPSIVKEQIVSAFGVFRRLLLQVTRRIPRLKNGRPSARANTTRY